jgi:hypothetical protein
MTVFIYNGQIEKPPCYDITVYNIGIIMIYDQDRRIVGRVTRLRILIYIAHLGTKLAGSEPAVAGLICKGRAFVAPRCRTRLGR